MKTGQNIKIHLFSTYLNRIVCGKEQGNGSMVTIEEFKNMMEKNDPGICQHCVKYLKSPRGRRIKWKK